MNYRSLVLAALGTAMLTHSAYQAGFVTTLSSHFHPMRTFQDLIREGYHVVVNKNSASIREIAQVQREFGYVGYLQIIMVNYLKIVLVATI